MFRLLGLSTLLFAVALFAVPAPAVDEKPDAEKLFKAMEEKLAKAKTVECMFAGTFESPNGKASFEGSFYLAEGDKTWFEEKHKEDFIRKKPRQFEMRVISDGKKVVASREPERDTDKRLNPMILRGLSSEGLHNLVTITFPLPGAGQRGGYVEDKNPLRRGKLELGKQEKIGDEVAQSVEYSLSDQAGDKWNCTLWIVLKTQLPVKRTITKVEGDRKSTTTETYTKLILDGKIDPAKFELPKSDEKPDAETLFKAMEEKLAKAKAFQCDFELVVEAEKQGGKMKGTVLLAEGDKARLEINGEFAGMKSDLIMLSDGKKMLTIQEGKASPEAPATKGLNRQMLAMFGRAGIFAPLFIARVSTGGRDPKDEKIEDLLKVSDLKLGKKEKINGVECQALEFAVTFKDDKESMACVVWIDPKTNLPTKRTITIGKKMDNAKVTEVYSKIELDGKIDEAKFALPK